MLQIVPDVAIRTDGMLQILPHVANLTEQFFNTLIYSEIKNLKKK